MPPAPPAGRSLVPLSAVSSSGTQPPHAPISITQFTPRGLSHAHWGWWSPQCREGLRWKCLGCGACSSCSVWKARLLVAAGVKPRPPPIAPCIVTLHRVITVTCHVVSQSTVDLYIKKDHYTESSLQDRMNCHSTRGHKCQKSRSVTKLGKICHKSHHTQNPPQRNLQHHSE